MIEANTPARVFSVSELTKSIKMTLEGKAEFNGLWVAGEISNLTHHSSGHIYFTLKDENAVIQAVFFRHHNRRLTFRLKEGMSVIAQGSITLFEKRGNYQITITSVMQTGVGELQQRIEALKKKLLAEGVFDPRRRRALPFFPRRLGIVTSPTGAAVRDIIKVALRRFPNIEIVIAPALVQGEGAAASIVRGIEELNQPRYGLDVIICGRGGGSFEDLMPFNEEPVVRAFYGSRVPIISAVGHQVDHPLCDEAADMAAPTPSAAAELAVPVKEDLLSEIVYLRDRADMALQAQYDSLVQRLEAVASRRVFRDPYDIINRAVLQLSDMENRMSLGMRQVVSACRTRFFEIRDITMLVKNVVMAQDHRFNLLMKALEQLSPFAVLQRGYAIALDARQTVIRSVHDANPGDHLQLMLHDGSLRCTVNTRQEGDRIGKKETAEERA